MLSRANLPANLRHLDAAALAALGLLSLALLAGGASRLHELRLALVELSAMPLILIAASALMKRDHLGPHKFAVSLVGLIVLLPLTQLIPLPPTTWTALPGRDQLELALQVTGLPSGWQPISLTPDKTWRSVLALLPPVAMFLGVIATKPESHPRLIYALLLMTLVAIFLGALQFASGSKAFHLWQTTAPGTVSGFFANRNHMATLCLISVPFAMVLGAGSLRRRSEPLGRFWLAALFIVIVAIALGVIRSRAGITLFGLVVGTSLLAAWIASGRHRPKLAILVLVGAATVGVVAVGAFAAGPILARFDPNAPPEGRFENWPIVAEAAQIYLPLGSGIGSFDAVYRSVEPLQLLDPSYFNQAHNDYLETWLEAGWFGLALIIAFLIWFGRRCWRAWQAGVSTQRDLQRAATIAIGAVLLHSLADYPLRTAAIATIFALCCGVLELAVRTDQELNPHRPRQRTRS